jgi:hypothetical protein
MRPAEGAYINNVARLEKAEEIEEASEAIDKEIAQSASQEIKSDAEVTTDGDEDDNEEE